MILDESSDQLHKYIIFEQVADEKQRAREREAFIQLVPDSILQTVLSVVRSLSKVSNILEGVVCKTTNAGQAVLAHAFNPST